MSNQNRIKTLKSVHGSNIQTIKVIDQTIDLNQVNRSINQPKQSIQPIKSFKSSQIIQQYIKPIISNPIKSINQIKLEANKSMKASQSNQLKLHELASNQKTHSNQPINQPTNQTKPFKNKSTKQAFDQPIQLKKTIQNQNHIKSNHPTNQPVNANQIKKFNPISKQIKITLTQNKIKTIGQPIKHSNQPTQPNHPNRTNQSYQSTSQSIKQTINQPRQPANPIKQN